MQFETDIRPKDIETYMQYVGKMIFVGNVPGKKSFSYLKLCFIVLCVAYFMFLFEYYGNQKQYFDWVSGGAVMFPFLLVLVQIIIASAKQMTKSMPLEDGVILGIHAFEVNEEGISEEAKNYTSFTKWCAVKSLAIHQDYIYLFLDTTVAHIIPKKSFTSQSEVNKFIELVNNKVESKNA